MTEPNLDLTKILSDYHIAMDLAVIKRDGQGAVMVQHKAEDALKSLISDQVAKAKYDIAEEMGKMMEIQGVDGTWNYDPYMHGMYNGMEFCHALAKGVEPKYRKAPKQWLADIPMPKNAKPTQTYPKRSKE